MKCKNCKALIFERMGSGEKFCSVFCKSAFERHPEKMPDVVNEVKRTKKDLLVLAVRAMVNGNALGLDLRKQYLRDLGAKKELGYLKRIGDMLK